MNFPDKIVTTIPLQNLWIQENYIETERICYLTRNDLKELLKTNSIKFVVANVGQSLKWVDATQCYHFWKSEVENHLAENINKLTLTLFLETMPILQVSGRTLMKSQ